MEIVRQEMDRAGAVEVLLPTFQPIELWEQTGRRVDYGDNLFVVNDRHKSAYALGPTHEEVAICHRCMKQGAGRLHKDPDWDWTKPTLES